MKMIEKVLFLFSASLFILICTASSNNPVFAHPGNKDSSGGHTCWTNCEEWGLGYGEYHYHNGGTTSSGYVGQDATFYDNDTYLISNLEEKIEEQQTIINACEKNSSELKGIVKKYENDIRIIKDKENELKEKEEVIQQEKENLDGQLKAFEEIERSYITSEENLNQKIKANQEIIQRQKTEIETLENRNTRNVFIAILIIISLLGCCIFYAVKEKRKTKHL